MLQNVINHNDDLGLKNFGSSLFFKYIMKKSKHSFILVWNKCEKEMNLTVYRKHFFITSY